MTILVDTQIQELIDNNWITSDNKIEPNQIQPASLDLRIGNKAYRVSGSSCPDINQTKEEFLEQIMMYDFPIDDTAILETRCKYLIELQERFKLPSDTFVLASNKSSSGRNNLQVKLISYSGYDRMSEGFNGEVFIEVTPSSFPVKIQRGISLNQVRFYNNASMLDDSTIIRNWKTLGFYDASENQIPLEKMIINKGIIAHVDLSSEVIGYRAKKSPNILDLSKRNHYSPEEFFEILRLDKGRLLLQKGEFYIFSTKEFIRVPPAFAIEMVPYDITTGEFRSHYAGFFDPGFGYGNNGKVLGTPATLEILPHDDIILKDGQAICKFIIDRCFSTPENPYGSGQLESNYQFQRGPSLSKHFKRD